METEIEHKPTMRKKTKTTKPLPSALTVASPNQHVPATPRQPPSRTLSAVAAVKPSAPSPTSKPIPTTGRTFSKRSSPLAVAPLSEAPPTINTRFVLLEPHAKRVALCGGFNAWSPHATPLNRQNDGLWETSLALPPGRYEYKFVVDGHWLPDPNAHENVCNGYGTLNSVIEVRA